MVFENKFYIISSHKMGKSIKSLKKPASQEKTKKAAKNASPTPLFILQKLKKKAKKG